MEQYENQERSVIGTMLEGLEADAETGESPVVYENENLVLTANDDEIEIDDSFSLEGFQVVRREFFAHIFEPSIVLQDNKVGFNTACLKKLPKVEYIQFLVNRTTKKLAVRPCLEGDSDSFLWCSNGSGKRKPRQVSGKWFFLKIADLMKWNPNHRYKVLGKLIQSNGERLFVFDLNFKETYTRKVGDGNKVKTSRVPVLDNQADFGLPVEEHANSMQVNIFEGYAVYGIKGPAEEPSVQGLISQAEKTNAEQSELSEQPIPVSIPSGGTYSE